MLRNCTPNQRGSRMDKAFGLIAGRSEARSLGRGKCSLNISTSPTFTIQKSVDSPRGGVLTLGDFFTSLEVASFSYSEIETGLVYHVCDGYLIEFIRQHSNTIHVLIKKRCNFQGFEIVTVSYSTGFWCQKSFQYIQACQFKSVDRFNSTSSRNSTSSPHINVVSFSPLARIISLTFARPHLTSCRMTLTRRLKETTFVYVYGPRLKRLYSVCRLWWVHLYSYSLHQLLSASREKVSWMNGILPYGARAFPPRKFLPLCSPPDFSPSKVSPPRGGNFHFPPDVVPVCSSLRSR